MQTSESNSVPGCVCVCFLCYVCAVRPRKDRQTNWTDGEKGNNNVIDDLSVASKRRNTVWKERFYRPSSVTKRIILTLVHLLVTRLSAQCARESSTTVTNRGVCVCGRVERNKQLIQLETHFEGDSTPSCLGQGKIRLYYISSSQSKGSDTTFFGSPI